jgi:DNA-binding Lrp family transcriptional regulator
MDDIDKRLVSLLQKDGRMSLTDIGQELGMSHVAISKRLTKLTETNEMVKVTAGVNAEKLDTKVLFMGIETEDMDVVDRIQDKYKDCPRLLMLAPVTGQYNLFAVMVAEDTWTLESIMGTCSMRTEPGVRKSQSWLGNAPIVPQFLEINLAPNYTKKNIAPCERNCASCKRFEADKCVGCPTTACYKGDMWAEPKPKGKSKS